MEMLNKKVTTSTVFVIVMAAVFLVSGCARTKQARSAKTHSGFLGDYSMLEKGEKGEAMMAYINPDADWPSYSKILLDPVDILSRAEEQANSTPQEDYQMLANNFYSLLYKEFSKDYEMVKEPGPRTLRFQVALTDVEKSWAVTNTITSVIPVGIVISAGKNFATGKPSFVGEVSVEAKILDARTGQLLAMGLDRRVGSGSIRASVDNWDDANKILEVWSKMMRFRLCKHRGDKDCTRPKE
jgi:hypothetical protein